MALLEVAGLKVSFGTGRSPFMAVDGLDLAIDAGEIVGCVGESGSGKSVTALALMGLDRLPGTRACAARELRRSRPAARCRTEDDAR